MRILFTTSPLIGHLRPMLPLLRAAARAGHEVLVASGPDLVREVQRRGYQTWTVGPSAQQIVTEIRADRTATDDHLRLASLMFGRPSLARARDLLPRANRWRPDLVVHDLTELAGAETAALTGAREIVVAPAGEVAPAEALLPAITAELAAGLGTPDRYAELTAATLLDPRVPDLAPDQPTAFADVRPLRPELDEPRTRLPLRTARFGDRTTVLLSLGRHDVRAQTLRTALDGLRDLGVNVIVEVGPYFDLAGLDQPPRNVAVAPVIDYARALPLCQVVIGTGAAALAVGALSHGLPQVMLPRTREQLATARSVAGVGAGIILQPDRLEPGPVRRALANVVADPAYARAARTQQAAIAALPAAADVLTELTTATIAA